MWALAISSFMTPSTPRFCWGVDCALTLACIAIGMDMFKRPPRAAMLPPSVDAVNYESRDKAVPRSRL